MSRKHHRVRSPITTTSQTTPERSQNHSIPIKPTSPAPAIVQLDEGVIREGGSRTPSTEASPSFSILKSNLRDTLENSPQTRQRRTSFGSVRSNLSQSTAGRNKSLSVSFAQEQEEEDQEEAQGRERVRVHMEEGQAEHRFPLGVAKSIISELHAGFTPTSADDPDLMFSKYVQEAVRAAHPLSYDDAAEGPTLVQASSSSFIVQTIETCIGMLLAIVWLTLGSVLGRSPSSSSTAGASKPR